MLAGCLLGEGGECSAVCLLPARWVLAGCLLCVCWELAVCLLGACWVLAGCLAISMGVSFKK